MSTCPCSPALTGRSRLAIPKSDALVVVRRLLLRPRWRRAVFATLVAIGLLLLNDMLVFESILIPSTSMEPAVFPNERVLLEKLPFQSVGRFDVVVINSRRLRERIVKRVIGLPGERIRIEGREVQLGPNEYFVLGDNRAASRDSRVIGPVSSGEIEGKVKLVWYSFDLHGGRPRWGRIFHAIR